MSSAIIVGLGIATVGIVGTTKITKRLFYAKNFYLDSISKIKMSRL